MKRSSSALMAKFWKTPSHWFGRSKGNVTANDAAIASNAAFVRHIEVSALVTLSQAHRQAEQLVERRARLASIEAKGYADQGLAALGSSMKAAHKVLARTTGKVDRIEHLFTSINSELRKIEERMEFIRSENMYEMQALLHKAQIKIDSTQPFIDSEILNPDKLSEMRGSGLRINIGCGHIQPEGFLNVDGRALPGVDIVSEATAIPLNEGEVEEIFSSHLIEHFSRHILERALLPHWRSLLKSGGVLTTIAPDGAAMLDALHTGEMSFEDFREVLFGGQDYNGDFHYNLIRPGDFIKLLERENFTDITINYSGKRNGKCFEFKISARKR